MSSTDTDPTEHRRSLVDRARARPWLLGAVALVLVALLVVVLVVFQPQRLFYDEVVDDEFPTVDPTPGADDAMEGEATTGDPEEADTASEDGMGQDDPDEAAAAEGGSDAMASEPGDDGRDTTTGADDRATEAPADPVALATGAFTARSRYTVTGTATVYELGDGSRTLRLEDFESTNGPSLFVYLTAADAEASDGELDANYVDLGALRGNVGNQNYEIPAEVDLEVYDTVVIWCRPFSVAFGAADLG